MRTDPSSSSASPSGPIDALAEYKIRASKLLKDFASADKRRAFHAAHRLAALWPDKDANALLADKASIQRKHALAVIAREMGFRDWRHLTREAHVELPAFDTTRLFRASTSFYLNAWFTTYEEARDALSARKDRFLFPYRHQFVVCEGGLLASLGIDVKDPDWDLIGRDWAKPQDAQAHYRLNQKLARIVPPLPERRRPKGRPS